MTSSNGNIFRVTGHLCGDYPTQRPVTRSFDVFFDLRLNKRLSKQSEGWWFETLSRQLWRHCNDTLGELPKRFLWNLGRGWYTRDEQSAMNFANYMIYLFLTHNMSYDEVCCFHPRKYIKSESPFGSPNVMKHPVYHKAVRLLNPEQNSFNIVYIFI